MNYSIKCTVLCTMAIITPPIHADAGTMKLGAKSQATTPYDLTADIATVKTTATHKTITDLQQESAKAIASMKDSFAPIAHIEKKYGLLLGLQPANKKILDDFKTMLTKAIQSHHALLEGIEQHLHHAKAVTLEIPQETIALIEQTKTKILTHLKQDSLDVIERMKQSLESIKKLEKTYQGKLAKDVQITLTDVQTTLKNVKHMLHVTIAAHSALLAGIEHHLSNTPTPTISLEKKDQ